MLARHGKSQYNLVIPILVLVIHNHFPSKRQDKLWSPETDDSRTTLEVSGKDDDGVIEVNFGFQPIMPHLGQSVNFRVCTEMYPESQRVDDDDAELQFLWEVDWNNEGDWIYIGDTESFSYTNLQEGTHTVKLSITFEDETVICTQELVVLYQFLG